MDDHSSTREKQTVKLTFYPDEYWEIYVTPAQEKHRRHKKELINHLITFGLLILFSWIYYSLNTEVIPYTPIDHLVNVSGFLVSIYFFYTIYTDISNIRKIHLKKLKSETIDWIERCSQIKYSSIEYDQEKIKIKIDDDENQFNWEELVGADISNKFVRISWGPHYTYIFSKGSMDKAEFPKLKQLIEKKIEYINQK